MAKAKSAIPPGLHSVTPHLIAENGAAAIDWYKQAFGAEEVGGRALGPNGRIMHAEIRIGNSIVDLNGSVAGEGDYTDNRATNSGDAIPPKLEGSREVDSKNIAADGQRAANPSKSKLIVG